MANSGNSWWTRPSSGQRIGRIGEWGGSDSSSGRPSSSGPRISSLSDIGGSSGPPMGGAPGGFGGPERDHEGDDDDEGPAAKDEGENWYAGGERSGISVQNPDRGNVPGGDVVRDLLRRAAEGGPAPAPPGAPANPAAGNRQWGAGNTLGSDEVDSAFIPDPTAPPPEAQVEDEGPQVRHITFWREGFSVEDGPLMRYDDPANSQVLNEINAGRAPPSVLNVQPGQPVELRVARRLNEAYVPPPPKPAAPFSGSGMRLGGVVPEVSGAPSGAPPAMPGGFSFEAGTSTPPPERASSRGAEAGSIQTRFEVDQTQPTTSVQVRLADGTRLICRMNLTHTVGDIRNFINASRPENNTRAYTINLTFPNRALEDDTQTIEQAGLKNAVVVQRWV